MSLRYKILVTAKYINPFRLHYRAWFYIISMLSCLSSESFNKFFHDFLLHYNDLWSMNMNWISNWIIRLQVVMTVYMYIPHWALFMHVTHCCFHCTFACEYNSLSSLLIICRLIIVSKPLYIKSLNSTWILFTVLFIQFPCLWSSMIPFVDTGTNRAFPDSRTLL